MRRDLDAVRRDLTREQALRLGHAVRRGRMRPEMDSETSRGRVRLIFLGLVSSVALCLGLSLDADAVSAAATRTEEQQMKFRTTAAALALITSSTAMAQAVEWKVEDGGNGHWYVFQPRVSNRNWYQWRSLAESTGAHLATITSVAENTFITQTVLASAPTVCGFGGAHAYLGGYQDAGSAEPTDGWKWVTGEPFVLQPSAWFSLEDCCGGSYCNGDGEDTIAIVGKNGECTTGSLNVGLWNDVGKCLDWWGAVFEWSADCNGDGIVDYGQCLDGTLSDVNSNNIPDCCEGGSVCPCAGDADENAIVDAIDLAIVLALGECAQGLPAR